MKLIKNLGISPYIFVFLIVLAIARVSNPDLFKANADAAVQEVLNNKNKITIERLKNQAEPFLLVNLDKNEPELIFEKGKTVHIPFEKLLERQNQKLLRGANKPIILYAENIEVSTKAWVILNQLKFKNVLIIREAENREVLKYKFQPDPTVTGPEHSSI